MDACSERTGRTYDSWDDLVAAEANGWAVVIVLGRRGPGPSWRVFARPQGPFATKTSARNRAAVLRRRWRHELADHPATDLLSVNVEPLWQEL